MAFLFGQKSQSLKFKHYTKSGFLGGLITHPERDFFSTGVESAGSALVISSLDFFYSVFSLLLLAGGEFAIVDGVSAEGLTESSGSCTSGIDDGGGIRAIAVGSSLDRFPGHLTGTYGRCHCCAMVVLRGLMSYLFRLIFLLLLSMMIPV